MKTIQHRTCLMLLLSLAAIVLPVSPSFGSDDGPAAVASKEDDASEKEANPSGKESEPNSGDNDKKTADEEKGTPLKKLVDELFKEVDETGGQKKKSGQQAFDEKFDRVAKGMRTASGQLDEKKTGDETTKIQEQVVRDLEELIKQLQNPPPNNGGGGGGGGGGGSSGGASGSKGGRGGSGRQQLKPGGRNQQSGKAGEKPQNGGGPGKQEREQAEGSEERSETDRKAAEAANRQKKLEHDVWGHLPPHLREKLLNSYGERMLPKYENLVKQFYEALSEQGDSKTRRDSR